MRNLRSKAPESQWPEIALRARGCYEAASPALAAVLRDDFVAAYERELPAVVQCFRDDFDACIAHLRFPLRHRRVIRTTNLLERLFLEERRRTKIIPHAFGERPVLKLMYAAVIRAADRWRGLAVGEFRAASDARDPRGARSRPCRAHAARRTPHPERVPVEVIQQGSDLTRVDEFADFWDLRGEILKTDLSASDPLQNLAEIDGEFPDLITIRDKWTRREADRQQREMRRRHITTSAKRGGQRRM